MLKSLYSGVSGMKSLQTKMDVVSNNIANVNTTGFKAGRVRFQDIMSQTEANAQGPNDFGLGGTNARQVGLGVKVGAIDTMTGVGAPQPTGRPLDFALDAGGYFILDSGNGDTKFYSRDGAFTLDNEGNLVSSSGFKVMSRGVSFLDENGQVDGQKLIKYDKDFTNDQLQPTDDLKTVKIPTELKGETGDTVNLVSYSIDSTGLITGKYSDDNTYVLGQIQTATFANPDGLEKTGGNNYVVSGNSGEPTVGAPGSNGSGKMVQGALEGSNVDLANEFTEMIIASRAYQANSRSISTSDEMLQELINLKR
ncbi:flagellar hook-basal body complex protein [Vagococcus silagei]|uniref:Flagellar hook protein FlgE n=1 Tax=Vagococcus silagei TaxID=2508885 RepID=A0A4S3B4V9_9ENTE|nr:flagellar hook-basal body complex protein [Vagococcus silagei]THB61337.1 flagellar hook-basal body complex protein [Vagococcus silagei]